MATQPLIERKLIFGNPDVTGVQLSPDGANISYLASLDGVLNVWVAPRESPSQARSVTRDTGRGVRIHFWTFTNRQILYLQDAGGDENWHVYCVDLDSGSIRDLTPFEGVQAQPLHVCPSRPTELMVGLNHRDPVWHDLYRIDIVTGKMALVVQHDRFAGFVMDNDNQVKLAYATTPDGGMDIFRYLGGGEWQIWDSETAEDLMTSAPIGFDKSGEVLYKRESRGRNTAALASRRLDDKSCVILAEDSRCDVGGCIIHPTEKHIQAVDFPYLRQRWQILDQAIGPDMTYLAEVTGGEVHVASRSLDDRWWVVGVNDDVRPPRYYLYDHGRRSASFMFSTRKALDGLPLTIMHSTVIKSRDGLDLTVYYSLPVDADTDGDGRPDVAVPMVFVPHGGPWGRDHWGCSGWHQWLANRGYAVMNVNFRSSTGFGKSFVNAGNLEWGGKIMEDQVDAVKWAIDAGIADPRRIAIFGGSFGGYSALCGLTLTPDLFACGVDLVGPANLVTLLESMPPYWKAKLEMFTTRVGDHRTEEGRALLKAHSPLTYADRIRKPLLIGQGANDPRVKRAESDQIVNALKEKSIPVTYVLYPDEGHGFARPENNLSFYAIAEQFLAQNLGGRCEPIGGDFAGSSLQVLAGEV